MLSQAVDYSLRAVVTVAKSPEEPLAVGEIATRTKVPAPYLAKLMQNLVHAGVLKSRRGIGGGFVLAKPTAEISIWDIVEATDPIERIEKCPLGIPGHTHLCPVHKQLDDALAHVERVFRAATIEQLLTEEPTGPLCEKVKSLGKGR